MTPGESIYDVTDKLAITGAAYIDGKLHIQTRGIDRVVGSIVEWDYRRPCFLDADGNEIRELDYVNFSVEVDGHEIQYVECVYDIPEEDLGSYTMVIELIDDDAITSSCSVTFEIADVAETAE